MELQNKNRHEREYWQLITNQKTTLAQIQNFINTLKTNIYLLATVVYNSKNILNNEQSLHSEKLKALFTFKALLQTYEYICVSFVEVYALAAIQASALKGIRKQSFEDYKSITKPLLKNIEQISTFSAEIIYFGAAIKPLRQYLTFQGNQLSLFSEAATKLRKHSLGEQKMCRKQKKQRYEEFKQKQTYFKEGNEAFQLFLQYYSEKTADFIEYGPKITIKEAKEGLSMKNDSRCGVREMLKLGDHYINFDVLAICNEIILSEQEISYKINAMHLIAEMITRASIQAILLISFTDIIELLVSQIYSQKSIYKIFPKIPNQNPEKQKFLKMFLRNLQIWAKCLPYNNFLDTQSKKPSRVSQLYLSVRSHSNPPIRFPANPFQEKIIEEFSANWKKNIEINEKILYQICKNKSVISSDKSNLEIREFLEDNDQKVEESLGNYGLNDIDRKQKKNHQKINRPSISMEDVKEYMNKKLKAFRFKEDQSVSFGESHAKQSFFEQIRKERSQLKENTEKEESPVKQIIFLSGESYFKHSSVIAVDPPPQDTRNTQNQSIWKQSQTQKLVRQPKSTTFASITKLNETDLVRIQQRPNSQQKQIASDPWFVLSSSKKRGKNKRNSSILSKRKYSQSLKKLQSLSSSRQEDGIDNGTGSEYSFKISKNVMRSSSSLNFQKNGSRRISSLKAFRNQNMTLTSNDPQSPYQSNIKYSSHKFHLKPKANSHSKYTNSDSSLQIQKKPQKKVIKRQVNNLLPFEEYQPSTKPGFLKINDEFHQKNINIYLENQYRQKLSHFPNKFDKIRPAICLTKQTIAESVPELFQASGSFKKKVLKNRRTVFQSQDLQIGIIVQNNKQQTIFKYFVTPLKQLAKFELSLLMLDQLIISTTLNYYDEMQVGKQYRIQLKVSMVTYTYKLPKIRIKYFQKFLSKQIKIQKPLLAPPTRLLNFKSLSYEEFLKIFCQTSPQNDRFPHFCTQNLHLSRTVFKNNLKHLFKYIELKEIFVEDRMKLYGAKCYNGNLVFIIKMSVSHDQYLYLQGAAYDEQSHSFMKHCLCEYQALIQQTFLN